MAYHSITFGNKNTFDDWHLVPSSRPLFNPPKQKITLMDIPGSDGTLDLSETLTGYPVYNNREGSLEFIVLNDFKEWQNTYSDIMDYIHGRVMNAILEDDPNYYYKGRFSINEWKSDKDHSKITIDYVTEPYKLLKLSSIEDATLAQSFKNIVIDSGTPILKTFQGLIGRKPVCPTFIISTTGGMTIRLKNDELGIDSTKVLNDGTIVVSDFILSGLTENSTMSFWFTGHGTVSIVFRNGRL